MIFLDASNRLVSLWRNFVNVPRPRCKLDLVETTLADESLSEDKPSYLDLLLFPRKWPCAPFPQRTVHWEHPLEVKPILYWMEFLAWSWRCWSTYPATKSNLKIHTWVYSQPWGKTKQNNTLKSFLLYQDRKSWPNREYKCLGLVGRPRKSNPVQLGQIFLVKHSLPTLPGGC